MVANALSALTNVSTRLSIVFFAVLLFLSSASLLPKAGALPRRQFGRHLILSHRHHINLRSAGQLIEVACTPAQILDCQESNMSVSLQNLKDAITVSNLTRKAIQDFLVDWLKVRHNLPSLIDADVFFRYHMLNLNYALHADANNVNYDVSDTKSLAEELPKIIDSLSVIYHLLNHVNATLKEDDVNDFFNHIREKIQHNKFAALHLLSMDDKCVSVPSYTYNANHDSVPFAVVRESIKLLELIEKKYKHALILQGEQ